eukprot:jgi/Ulvmu1/5342/UM022_0136.1
MMNGPEHRVYVGRDAHAHPSQDLRSMIANNPFRTPQILAENKEIRMNALRRSMRGITVLGVDGKVWIWLSQWLLLPVLYGCTSLGTTVNAWAFPTEPISKHHAVYLLILASILVAFAAAYMGLYGSDPGFLGHQRGDDHPGTQQLQLPGASACPYCGSFPTARSKHSKGSGQCVHKFDHFCWWLSTDIGDRNHGLFWVYMMMQFGLNVWAGHLLLSEMHWCVAAGGVATYHCHLQAALHWGLVVVCLGVIIVTGLLFGYLAILHTYLLLTGQTMFEILRGSKVSYLAPYYRGRSRGQYRLPQEMLLLFYDDLMGRGPPRPFSQGMVDNVRLQLFSAWPRPYMAQ